MKLFDHLPHGTVTVIILVVGIYAIYQSGALNKAVSLAENAANKNSETVLDASKSFWKRIREKDSQLADDSSKIAELSLKVEAESIKTEQLKSDLAIAKSPHDTIVAQNRIISEQSTQLTDLSKKCNIVVTDFNTCKEEKKVMQSRIHTLETTLSNQVESTKCHILFFGCPSRVASFEVGGGLGTILGIIITVAIKR